jgi:hypothetical protein
MSKPRSTIPLALTILTLLATTAAVAGTRSADAAECKKNTTTFTLCTGEPLTLTTGTFNLHINNDPTTPTKAWIWSGKSAGIEFNCPEILSTTTAKLTSTSAPASVKITNITLHFVGCTAPKPAHCVINNGLILLTSLDGVTTGKDELLLLLPEKGATFGIFHIESSGGTCILAGNDLLRSEKEKEGEGPLCNLPSIEKTTILHLVECVGGATSHLKLGEEPEDLTGNASILLTTGTKWAVILGE